jgi:mannose/fructose/N-acetylgalactosamine-specific phosphotransferase system component IIC
VSLEVQLALLLWGTLVGLDLVSVPQMMIARPIVAGAGAGIIVGDLETGLRLGVLFELFQFDILPVGAARYPEYGPATVAAVSAGHLFAGPSSLGIGAVVGLLVGMVGGMAIHGMRRLTARAIARAAPALEAGDAEVLVRVHVGGIVRDGVRAALVTAAGLALAWVARIVLPGALTLRGSGLLAAAATAAGIAAGTAGALRLTGRGPNLGWFAVGLTGGAVAAWVR